MPPGLVGLQRTPKQLRGEAWAEDLKRRRGVQLRSQRLERLLRRGLHDAERLLVPLLVGLGANLLRRGLDAVAGEEVGNLGGNLDVRLVSDAIARLERGFPLRPFFLPLRVESSLLLQLLPLGLDAAGLVSCGFRFGLSLGNLCLLYTSDAADE